MEFIPADDEKGPGLRLKHNDVVAADSMRSDTTFKMHLVTLFIEMRQGQPLTALISCNAATTAKISAARRQ